MSEEKQYLGNHEVLSVMTLDYTTPSGGQVFKVILDNDSYEVMSKKSFDLFSTDEPSDLTELREKKFKIMHQEVAAIIMEYDIKFIDLSPFIQQLANKLQDAFERASNFLWTGDDKMWIPGFNFGDNRTLLEAEGVLKGINHVEEEDNSEGSGDNEPEGDRSDTSDQE